MRVAVPAAAALLALLTTGCTADAPASPPAVPAAAAARVGLTDFEISARPVHVLPGSVRLQVTNAGATLHDLVVRGSAGEWRTPFLRPGESAVLEVETTVGESLELWCSVAGHDAAGMRSALPVVAP